MRIVPMSRTNFFKRLSHYSAVTLGAVEHYHLKAFAHLLRKMEPNKKAAPSFGCSCWCLLSHRHLSSYIDALLFILDTLQPHQK